MPQRSTLFYFEGDSEPPDQSPVAVITVVSIDGLDVKLSGADSYDPEGLPLTYHWDMGDSTTYDTVTVEHEYAEAGTYDVTLLVQNSDGLWSAPFDKQVTVTTPILPPMFVAAGALVASATGVSPSVSTPLPAGVQTGDILVWAVETANQVSSVPDAGGGTWALITPGGGIGSAGASNATRLSLRWSRYDGSQTAPTTQVTGDHIIAQMFAFRGCITTGSPIAATTVVTGEFPETTTLVVPGPTTTDVQRLIVIVVVTATDSTGPNYSGWANANLADINERADGGSTLGNGGGLALTTGVKAASGAVGNTTATMVGNMIVAHAAFALIPA